MDGVSCVADSDDSPSAAAAAVEDIFRPRYARNLFA